jgi:sterol desaturase/sphingolipid hydroxylase (fatty acid hydroxylase superfamily)
MPSEPTVEFSPGIRYLLDQCAQLLFSFGSSLSLSSLAGALIIAVGFIAWRRLTRGRKPRLRLIVRALFPSRLLTSRSTAIDLGYLFYNTFLAGLLFGWATISYQFITNATIGGLSAAFGARVPVLPELVSRAGMTLAIFLAYEFGYWLNHYLNHRIPLLWEFHKVHHTADVLTPLTSFRVHPVYSFVFVNIVAITTALVNGLAHYAFGETAYQYALSDTNLILVLFIHAYVHLQHSHVWIAFTGLPGRILVSPAHHQLHHSMDPRHFNKNFGSCLAIWDWMFGTLCMPTAKSERLAFGVAPEGYDPHSISGALWVPIMRAARIVGGWLQPQAGSSEPTASAPAGDGIVAPQRSLGPI